MRVHCVSPISPPLRGSLQGPASFAVEVQAFWALGGISGGATLAFVFMEFVWVWSGQLRAIRTRKAYAQTPWRRVAVWVPLAIVVLADFAKLVVVQVCECRSLEDSEQAACKPLRELHRLGGPHGDPGGCLAGAFHRTSSAFPSNECISMLIGVSS
jgi:hypothetical protein